jgi:hypothetical protein
LKRDVSKGSDLTGEFTKVVREITASDFSAIRAAAAHAGCWASDHTCHAELRIEQLPGGAAVWVAVDGDSWLLEGARAAEHWGVTVDSPVASPFLEVCAAIVKAPHAEGQVRLPGRSSGMIRDHVQRPDGGIE